MATRIVFTTAKADSWLFIRAHESVDEVHQAWTVAEGKPFRVHAEGDEKTEVWINPANVAFWQEA